MAKILGTRFHYDNVFLANPLQLGKMKLLQIGEMCLESGFEVSPHNQFCSEISFVFSGKGYFVHGDRKVTVSAGDIIVSPPCGTHAIFADSDKEICYAYIGFDLNSDCWDGVDGLFCSKEPTVCRDGFGIYPYFKNCMDEFYRPQPLDKDLVESYILQIIKLTHRATLGLERQGLPNTPDTTGKIAYLVMKHVERNLSSDISVGKIADSLGYTPQYISHVFKAKIGLSPQQYIMKKKTEQATEWLKDGKLTASEISVRLGYSSLQVFSRAYKSATGKSPSEINPKTKNKIDR